MPLRRDNIALARTCSTDFVRYVAPRFQPRLPCLLNLAFRSPCLAAQEMLTFAAPLSVIVKTLNLKMDDIQLGI